LTADFADFADGEQNGEATGALIDRAFPFEGGVLIIL
jgi:hypothetical protein